MSGVGVLGFEALDAGGLAQDLDRGQGAAAGNGDQRRSEVLDEFGDLGGELLDLKNHRSRDTRRNPGVHLGRRSLPDRHGCRGSSSRTYYHLRRFIAYASNEPGKRARPESQNEAGKRAPNESLYVVDARHRVLRAQLSPP